MDANLHTTKDGAVAVSVREAARRLGIGRSLAYNLIAQGDLPSFKVGNRRLLLVSDVDDYAARRAAEKAAS